MTQPRTANFWEALKSAAARPGEVWYRMDIRSTRLVFDAGVLMYASGGVFRVCDSDLTATWVCET